MKQLFTFKFKALWFTLLGMFLWQTLSNRQKFYSPPDDNRSINLQSSALQIGNHLISQDEIDFNIRLLTANNELAFNNPNPSTLPPFQKSESGSNPELRDQVIADIIERTILYQAVQRDKSFLLNDPARFYKCLSEWHSLLQTHQKTGLIRDARDQELLKQSICQREIISQYALEKVFTSQQVSDSEVKEYYSFHKSQFAKPARVVIRQIFSISESKINELRKKAAPSNFSELAEKFSESPEGKSGGKLPPFSQGQLPMVFDIAFSMQVGEISPVVQSPHGYHLFILDQKLSRIEPTFESSKEEIINKIRTLRKSKEYAEWVEKSLAPIKLTYPRI